MQRLKVLRRPAPDLPAVCLLLICSLVLSGPCFVFGQQPAAAVRIQPPTERPLAAAMRAFQIPSHGSLINAFMYIAADAGPHPAVILLHGLPGNERNLDIAQEMRRAGWNVLYLDYRGSWGSPGEFSLTHTVEDVADAIAFVREPSVAATMRVDPKRIVLLGHSMGGFAAVQTAAQDASIYAVGLISPVDLEAWFPNRSPKSRRAWF